MSATATADIVDLALACYQAPLAHQSQLAPTAPLPKDMSRLLWLANGSPETLEAAMRQTGAEANELRDAARFLVQRLCFAHGASHYRVLGLEPDATPEQIKEHHRLLMRLFHPDRAANHAAWTGHYASRVNEAWTVLSRPQSRIAYDIRLRPPPEPSLGSTATRPMPDKTRRRRTNDRRQSWFAASRRWLPGLVLGGSALAAALLVWEMREAGSPTAPPGAAPVIAQARVAAPESADRSAIGAFLVAPDWQALRQREQPFHQQVRQTGDTQESLERVRQERLAVDAMLLERLQAERSRLEEQLRAEQMRAEQVWSERLAAEHRKLERLQAEQARAEQARTERLAAGQRQLEDLQAEQARAEQAAAALERVATTGSAGTPIATVDAPGADELTVRDLDHLIERYTGAYQRANLDELMILFAPDARGKDGSDRARIRRDYAALFDTYLIRRLQLNDLRWERRGPAAGAAAHYELWLRRRDNGGLLQLTGSIRIEARKQDGRILIEAIDYDWPAR